MGQHWVAIYIDTNSKGEYYDPTGGPPFLRAYVNFILGHTTPFSLGCAKAQPEVGVSRPFGGVLTGNDATPKGFPYVRACATGSWVLTLLFAYLREPLSGDVTSGDVTSGSSTPSLHFFSTTGNVISGQNTRKKGRETLTSGCTCVSRKGTPSGSRHFR
jgi:hypothetical protein